MKLVRPVGKRTMAEGVHVAATRLVWQRREHTYMGRVWLRSALAKSRGQEVAVAVDSGIIQEECWLNIQTSAIKQRWPKHNFQGTPEGAGWTTRTACLEGCLARARCVYPPALSSAIAGNQPATAAAVGLIFFFLIAPRMFNVSAFFSPSFCFIRFFFFIYIYMFSVPWFATTELTSLYY